MRFYIASGLENVDTVRSLAGKLKALGHEHTYDWTTHASMQAFPEKWRETAVAEANGVLTADLVIVLLPGARGTHTELGIALGNGASVIVAGKDNSARTCIFYHHPEVIRLAEHTDDKSEVEACVLNAVKTAYGVQQPLPSFCAVCREVQYHTVHGITCPSGHGGADSVGSAGSVGEH